jgi:LysM repeat protein
MLSVIHHRSSQYLGKAASLLLILAFLAGALPIRTFAAAAKCQETYIVKSSDTFRKIANAFDVRWEELAAANKMDGSYALFVGQKLCIPDSKKSVDNRKAPDTKPGNFSASIQGNNLRIETTNFPKKNSFVVKIDNAGKAGYEWIKHSILRTKKDSSGTYVLGLTGKQRDWTSINVCLKNLTTDVLICRIAR